MAFSPYSKTNIPDYIEAYEHEQVTEGTISFKEKINDQLIIKFHNVLTKYSDLLTPYIITLTLSDEDFQKYKFLPNKFCYDMYGTPELAYSLLYINNMVSVTEFSKQTIKVFVEAIGDVLKEIIVLSRTDLDNSHVRVLT